MSSTGLDELLAELAASGTRSQADGTFTLEAGRARSKLQKFALNQPEHYLLLLVAALEAAGTESLNLTVDSDDLILQSSQEWDREPFRDLWSQLLGSTHSKIHGALKLLAVAVLTSFRLQDIDWTIESSDQFGPWRFELVVRKGEVLKENLSTLQQIVDPGLKIWVKRRSLTQVGRRFLGGMANWILGRTSSDERLLRERLLLPRPDALSLNGKSLGQTLVGAHHRVLGVLRRSLENSVVTAAIEVNSQAKPSLLALLTDPTQPADPTLPGEPGQVTWIWHGLTMNSTSHGLRYPSVRVLVWSDEIQPDLSFSQIVDNRVRQQLERQAKDAIRDLIGAVAEWCLETFQQLNSPIDESYEPYLCVLRRAISNRIQVVRARNRLASLNRVLIAVPMFWGRDADNNGRLYSFEELWIELEEGRGLAPFNSRSAWTEVPAWPQRPLVLYTSAEEYKLLEQKFGRQNLNGPSLLKRELSKLLEQTQTQGVPTPAAPAKTDILLQGQFQHQDLSVTWWVVKEEFSKENGAPGATFLVRPEGTLTDPFPITNLPGITILVRGALSIDYRGRISDRELQKDLAVSFWSDFLERFSLSRIADRSLSQRLTDALLPIFAESLTRQVEDFQPWILPWLTVSTLNGQWSKMSPQSLKQRLDELRAPLYYLEEPPDPLPKPIPEDWLDLPLLILDKQVALKFTRALGGDFRPFKGLHRFLQRREGQDSIPSAQTSFMAEAIELSSWNPELQKLEVLCPTWDHLSPDGESQITHVFDGIPTSALPLAIPISGLVILAHWRRGWPDGHGRKLVNIEIDQDFVGKLSVFILQNVRALFLDLELSRLNEFHPKFVESSLFELITNDEFQDDPFLWTANGARVSISELRHKQTVKVFTTLAAREKFESGALYLPPVLTELLEHLLPEISIREADPKPEVKSSNSSVVVPGHASRTEVAESLNIAAQSKAPIEGPVKPLRKKTTPNLKQVSLESPEPPPSDSGESEDSTVRSAQGSPPWVEQLKVGDLYQQALFELWDQDVEAYPREFAEFVMGLQRDPEAQEVVFLKDDIPVLGFRLSSETEPKMDTRIMVLRTLFSLYQSVQEQPSSEWEHAFHAAIVQRSLKRRSGTALQ